MISKSKLGMVTNMQHLQKKTVKKDVTPSSLRGHRPASIMPTGLDAFRLWHFYEQIRPFCTTDAAKVTKPK